MQVPLGISPALSKEHTKKSTQQEGNPIPNPVQIKLRQKAFCALYSLSIFDLTLFVKNKNNLKIKTLKQEIFSIVKLMQFGLVQTRIFYTYSLQLWFIVFSFQRSNTSVVTRQQHNLCHTYVVTLVWGT